MRKVVFYILLIPITIIFLNILFVLFVPVYNYPNNIKFVGYNWYNPYKNYDNATYYMSNFHGHSRLGVGLLNGRNNTTEDVYKAYRDLGYKYVAISNYHTISEKDKNYNFPYIPALEYGINISKSHLLLTGSKERQFLDSILFQNADIIQYKINRIRDNHEIITVAHPDFLRAVSVNEARKLTNYDLMEVVNVYAHSFKQWDAALSNGRPAFMLASDDTHNVFVNTDFGRNITMVPVNTDNMSELYDTLKNGSTYAVSLSHKLAMLDRKEKKKVLEKLPSLSYIKEERGIVTIKLSEKADKITFISDNGNVINTFVDKDQATVRVAGDSSYVRINAVYANGDINLYFNPLVRSVDSTKPEMPKAEINILLYALKLIFAVILTAAFVYSVIKIRKKLNTKK